MRFLEEIVYGIPGAKPSKNLALVIRSRVVRRGFHTRLEQQWFRMVFHHNRDNLGRRLDTCWSGVGCIYSWPGKVGAHWRCIVARTARRRCWRNLSVEGTSWLANQGIRA